eukprot:SAG31_NODE_2032_length_6625_cov_3.010113_2_plen_391_part_00
MHRAHAVSFAVSFIYGPATITASQAASCTHRNKEPKLPARQTRMSRQTGETTVKEVKKALGDLIKHINANPAALADCFGQGKGATRQALKQLRLAWKPLTGSTPAHNLCAALHRMQEMHSQLDLQCPGEPQAVGQVATELVELWSWYLNAFRGLRVNTAANNSESEAHRRAQAARIDGLIDQMESAFEAGQLNDDQLPSNSAIAAADAQVISHMLKSWAVVHTQIGFLLLERLKQAAVHGVWAWFEAASILTDRLVVRAIVDSVAACELYPPAASDGYDATSYRLLATTILGLLLHGMDADGVRFSESAEGMAAKHVMMQEGALELAAYNLQQLTNTELHVATLTLTASICFGASVTKHVTVIAINECPHVPIPCAPRTALSLSLSLSLY